ncbi:hypothetical protein N0Y54_30060 [Nostoc punctiforme UO1]|uniref:hypothetical protein n=1 Tax=Nostoc punctiforme TaxID=272131 RepID=UPI0030A6522C
MIRPIDLAGHRYGKLLVKRRHRQNSKSGKARWICVCECGRETIVASNNLRSQQVCSCGICVRGKHNQSKSRTYKIWSSMKMRCLNPNDSSWNYYGGRGIQICERWKQSYEAFLDDMGECPSEQHSIDRIDFNGDYCPENTRWILLSEQGKNTRHNRVINAFGKSQILADWVRETGIANTTLRSRLNKGQHPEEALSTPVFRERLLTFDGETKSLTDWGRYAGIHPDTLSGRLSRGWSLSDALKKPINIKHFRKNSL